MRLISLDTPVAVDYSLTERPNYLRLHGGPYPLSVPACPTLFLRKQIHRFCTWETKVSFHPTSEYTEAGTVVWWNYFTFSSLGIRRDRRGRIIRFRSSDGNVVEKSLPSTEDIIMIVECGEEYKFGYRQPNNPEITWIGGVINRAMTETPPVGASFTGKHPG